MDTVESMHKAHYEALSKIWTRTEMWGYATICAMHKGPLAEWPKYFLKRIGRSDVP
jgi:hypothetical protein